MSTTPTPAQLRWQQWGVGCFFHFGINTYAGLEWSDGTQPASLFNPTDLDVEGWLDTAQKMGARYAVLTAKHHDGFCLWPTATTDYSVASSPWQDGQGDVVELFVQACRARGIAVGLYLSPWDRHCPFYADPHRYSQFYRDQLTELCTRYGELAELWFDGAGSDGYAYDWDAIMTVVHEHQPQALVFNMGEPTIRWVGNEDGLAADDTRYVVAHTPGNQYTDEVNDWGVDLYLPPEADVSIRPGWFWHQAEEPKSLDHLLAIAYRSLGWGANLLLNLPPNRAGQIDQRDRQRVEEWATEWQRRLDCLQPVTLIRLDVDSADQGKPRRWRLELNPAGPIDHLALRENLTGGQRVFRHRVFTPDGTLLHEGATIGSLRLAAFPAISADHLVVEIDDGVIDSVAAGRTGVEQIESLPVGFEASTETPD